MPIDILLPKLSFTMAEGVITEWLAEDGSEVREGQPLYVLEADKASQEIEAPASGVLNILGPTGEELVVGTVVATIT